MKYTAQGECRVSQIFFSAERYHKKLSGYVRLGIVLKISTIKQWLLLQGY